MEFIEGSRGIYKPIRVLFGTPIYEQAKQHCWHLPSYKVKIALLTELLLLQQDDQLPSELPAEAMIDLMVEDSKKTVRVQLWEFEVEGYDPDVQPLLKMTWEVNNSMIKRDIEFEARRLLNSNVPAKFKHAVILNKAREYARILQEQLREAPASKQSGPEDIVMDLVPRVVQGFWKPKQSTTSVMPSEKLSHVAVGVTKAVLDRVSSALTSTLQQVTFTRSERENMVQSIDQEVRLMYPADTLRKKLNNFEAEVLNIITQVTARHLCTLFEPHKDTAVGAQLETQEPRQEEDSVGPTPLPQDPQHAEAAPVASVLEGEVVEGQSIREQEPATRESPTVPESLDEASPGQEAEHTQEPTPLPQDPLPAEAAHVASVLEGEVVEGQLSRDPASVPAPPPPPPEIKIQNPSPTKTLPAVATIEASVLEDEVMDIHQTPSDTVKDKVKKTRIRRFFRWMRKRLSCGDLPKDDD